LQIHKNDIYFIIRVSLVFCVLSASFSFVGAILPERMPLKNPIITGSINPKEIMGHLIWGLAAGAVTLRIKYALVGGSLAVLIDSDHLIHLLQIEGIPRMSHSILFAIISMIILMAVFGKRDYILGAIVATSVLTHISFDIFTDETGFPLFTPFLNKILSFPTMDWIFFEILAIIIIGIVTLLVRRKELTLSNKDLI